MVFDASAKYDDIPMNDMIHQGPKLQRDVLLRFRRRPVAVICDIAEMYLQIGIAAEDKPFPVEREWTRTANPIYTNSIVLFLERILLNSKHNSFYRTEPFKVI